MPPVARLGDKCVSPAGMSGTITTGTPRYRIEDRPVARVGDTVTYTDGSTTVIAEQDPGLRVEGRGVARLGYKLADGGKIVEGSKKVTSDDAYPGAGSVAERVMVQARRQGLAFVPVDCERRAAEALGQAPAEDDEAPRPGTTLVHSDLADGGTPTIFPSASDPAGASASQVG